MENKNPFINLFQDAQDAPKNAPSSLFLKSWQKGHKSPKEARYIDFGLSLQNIHSCFQLAGGIDVLQMAQKSP